MKEDLSFHAISISLMSGRYSWLVRILFFSKEAKEFIVNELRKGWAYIFKSMWLALPIIIPCFTAMLFSVFVLLPRFGWLFGVVLGSLLCLSILWISFYILQVRDDIKRYQLAWKTIDKIVTDREKAAAEREERKKKLHLVK